MNHYLESAIYALARAVVEFKMDANYAVELLSDMSCDAAKEPLYIYIFHDCATTASRYEFDTVREALEAVIENINEFTE